MTISSRAESASLDPIPIWEEFCDKTSDVAIQHVFRLVPLMFYLLLLPFLFTIRHLLPRSDLQSARVHFLHFLSDYSPYLDLPKLLLASYYHRS